MLETWVQSLGWEDPPEKEMATHSSILAWKIPRAEEPGGLQSMGFQRVRQDWVIEHARMDFIWILTWTKSLSHFIKRWIFSNFTFMFNNLNQSLGFYFVKYQ